MGRGNEIITRASSLLLTAKRYTTDHEYVVLDSDTNIGTVGITDYAQKALGDVVFVELPAQDSEVTQGGECNETGGGRGAFAPEQCQSTAS